MKKNVLLIILTLTLFFSACGTKTVYKKTKEVNCTPEVKTDNLKTTELDWYFKPKNDGTTPDCPKESIDLLKNYNGYYLGDTSKKVIYLTFDEGYENGYSDKILDILKDNDVKAAFFVTAPYIKSNPELIKRMVNEGHLVCNHSNTHPSMPSIKNKDEFEKEFTIVEDLFTDITGKTMPKFFRPPMGKYSQLSMAYTDNLGYKTIFWSFAYNDWDPKKQPNPDHAKEIIKKRTHNGAIFLLHAVSKTNTEILDSLIKDWKKDGFEFKTLTELPEK